MPGRPWTLALAALLGSLALCSARAGGATVIVKYRRGDSPLRHHVIVKRRGLVTVGKIRGQHASVVRVSGDPRTAARRLDSSPGVVYAEPNVPLRIAAAPNDPLFARLNGLQAISVEAGWDAAGLDSYPGDGGVPVGIIDTGIDASHEDLRGKLVACAASRDGRFRDGSCADENDHGTHVSGTVAAIANNGVGIAGVAFNSPLIVCKALAGPDGSGTTADVANCIAWVKQRGAKVISMSLGGPSSITLRKAVRSAWNGGRRGSSLIVAAAGNDGDESVEYPAGYEEVVSVAATGPGATHASFSNVNPDVEIAAPGVEVLSAKRGGGYVSFSGTSMATPHVAGAAALLWGVRRRASARTIRSELDQAVADLGLPGRDELFGFGLVDLTKLSKLGVSLPSKLGHSASSIDFLRAAGNTAQTA
jgi:thermitase